MEADVASVQQHESGDIRSLTFEDGRVIEGENIVAAANARQLDLRARIELLAKDAAQVWGQAHPCAALGSAP